MLFRDWSEAGKGHSMVARAASVKTASAAKRTERPGTMRREWRPIESVAGMGITTNRRGDVSARKHFADDGVADPG